MTFVSVIIPTWNRAATIVDAVKSVLAQTYTHLEVIVVDSGSTDNTCELLKPFVDGKTVRLIKSEHWGAAAARNVGLAHAKGELIGFCDSDDMWLPKKLELQVALMERHPEIGLAYTDGMVVRGARIETPSYFSQRPPHRGMVFHDLLEQNFIPNVSVVVKKRCLNEIGGFDERVSTSEDYALWLRFCHRFQVGYVNEVLVKVHRHDENLTRDDGLVFQNHLKTLDAVRNDSVVEIPGSVLRRAYANTYRKMGYHFLLRKQFSLAKKVLRKSWAKDPLSLLTYRYLGALMLPQRLLNGILDRRIGRIRQVHPGANGAQR